MLQKNVSIIVVAAAVPKDCGDSSPGSQATTSTSPSTERKGVKQRDHRGCKRRKAMKKRNGATSTLKRRNGRVR